MSEEDEGILPFPRWVEISTRLLNLRGDERLDVFEELELDPAAWSKSDQVWVTRLAEDAEAERGDRLDIYGAACAAEMQRRRAALVATARAAEPVAAPVPEAASEPKAAAVGPVHPGVAGEPHPARPSAPSAAEASSAAAAALDSPLRVMSTPSVGVPEPTMAAAPPAPEREMSAQAEPTRPPKGLAGTSLSLDIPRGPALPFARVPAAPPALAVVEPPPAAPESPERRQGLTGTSPSLDVPRAARELPFKKAPSAAPSAPSPAVTLTLEQHASLCVELALAPESTTATLARYHLSPEAKAQLDQHFRERLAKDPEVKAVWDRAYKAYHQWLIAGRGAPR